MTTLFNQPLNVINVGIAMFSDDLKKQHVPVTPLDWTPPGQGNMQVVEALDQLAKKTLAEKIAAANQIALERIIQSHPVLVGYDQAINVVPGMTRTTILHAGPPVSWENMCGAMKGAVTGALVFEGLAKDLDDAARLAASGEIAFSPCHEHDCVGSMAGVTSASMFMHIVENKTYGNRAFTNLSEQMAKILRMGANDQSVIDRLNWMRDVLGPMLRDAMNIIGEIDLRLMLAQALHMGDECHNRNNAGTTLLIQALTPGLIQAGYPVAQQREVFEFVASSDYFSGPTWMAMCKAALDAAHGIEYSTVVTTMARNGYEFGLRVSGLPGQWFTGPAQQVIGPMFAGYKPEDSGLDIGDSAITETYGIGGFAMATAPAIVALVGGTVEEAIDFSRQMREITLGENPNVTIPLLSFMGIPTAIDITEVAGSGILPVINTAIAHKDASIGYTLASGVTMFIVPLFGLGAFMLAIIPMTAIVPILVFIGVVTANQVVRETPKVEVPVIFICLFPWIANWALTMMNSVMGAAGTNAAKIGTDVLHSKGIYYEGLVHLGNGAPLASMLWGCIAIFAIINKPLRGAVAAAGGALLALFGVIHAPVVGFAEGSSLMFVTAYLMMGGMFVVKHFLDSREVTSAASGTVAKEHV